MNPVTPRRRIWIVAAFCAVLVASGVQAAITGAEYFVDADPGEGLATSIALVESNANWCSLPNVAIPAALAPGLHEIGLRVCDSNGSWSAALLKRFTVYPADIALEPPTAISSTGTIAAAEYFVGADPGEGNGTPIPLEGAPAAAVALSSLSIPYVAGAGTWDVQVRVRDSAGNWSAPILRRFTVISRQPLDDLALNPGSTGSVFNIPDAHQQSSISIPRPPASTNVFSITILGTTLTLTRREEEPYPDFVARLVEEINGQPDMWPFVQGTLVDPWTIQIQAREAMEYPADWVMAGPGLVVTLDRTGRLGSDGRRIVAHEYFLDTEPEPGQGVVITGDFVSAYSSGISTALVATAGLRAGTHQIALRSQNETGQWGAPIYRRFTILTLGSKDAVDPFISLTNGTPLQWPWGSVFVDPGYAATDDVDGDISSRVEVAGEVGHTNPGAYSVVYRVADLAGNLTETTRVVNVVDSDPPQILGSMAVTFTNPPWLINIFEGLTAIDLQDGDLTRRIQIDSYGVDWSVAGVYPVIFSVADYSGLSTQVTRMVTITPEALFYPAFTNWMDPRADSYGADPSDLDRWDDPDGDGWLNWQEWLAETDPFDLASMLFLDYSNGEGMEQFSWETHRRIKYTLGQTTNMQEWVATAISNAPGSGSVTNWVREMDANEIKRFYRVEAGPRLPMEPDP